MAGYNETFTKIDGNTINASDFETEFSNITAAFNTTGGHKHDGTSEEGPVINLIGDAGASPINKVQIDTSNNEIGFWVDVASVSTEQVIIKDGAIEPVVDNDIDLGSATKAFKDLHIDGTATIATLSITNDGAGSNIDADQLDGQEGSYYLAAASYNAADVLSKLITVDGAGSLLDADLLDGQEGAYYLPAASYTAADVLAKLLTVDGAGSGLDADTLDGYTWGNVGTAIITSGDLAVDRSTGSPQLRLNTDDAAAFCQLLFSEASSGQGDINLSTASGTLTMRSLSSGGAVTNCSMAFAQSGAMSITGSSLNFNGSQIWTAGNDGTGSGLDADLLDGQEGAYYLAASSYTAADVLSKLLTVDGAGSNLDADLLDGVNSTSFLRSDAADIKTSGALTFNDNIPVNLGTGQDVSLKWDGADLYMDFDVTDGIFYVRDTSDVVAFAVNTTTNAIAVRNGGHTATASDDWLKLADLANLDFYAHSYSGVSYQKWYTGEWGANYTWATSSSGGEVENIKFLTNGDSPSTNKIQIWNGSVFNTVWHAGNDGTGSGLDADLLDGADSTSFLRSDAADTKTSGTLTIADNVNLDFGSSSLAEIYTNSVNLFTDINSGGDWFIRDGDSANATRFTFDVDNGRFTASGKLYSGGSVVANTSLGGVALTANDGYGNANVCFNHEDGTPEISGNSGRIVLNKDSSVDANFTFQLKSGVTASTPVSATTAMTMYENKLVLPDNHFVTLGTGEDIEMFWSGTNYFTDFQTSNSSWYIRNTSDANTFQFDMSTGDFNATGKITAGSELWANATAPEIVLYDSDSGTDNKKWMMKTSATQFTLETENDAGSAGAVAMRVTRSGTTVTEIDLLPTTLKYNGSEIGAYKGFRAYSSTDTSVTASTPQYFTTSLVTSMTEEWDTEGWFTPSTGRFQPDEAGYYQLTFTVRATALSGDGLQATLIKNTTTIVGQASAPDYGPGQVYLTVTAEVYFNGSTDFVTAYFSSYTDTSYTLLNRSAFSAHKIGT